LNDFSGVRVRLLGNELSTWLYEAMMLGISFELVAVTDM
jgi:hypothetical protein